MLILLALCLTVHLIGMVDHTTGMMGACLAVIVGLIASIIGSIGQATVPAAPRPPAARIPIAAERAEGIHSRSPPADGTVMLC